MGAIEEDGPLIPLQKQHLDDPSVSVSLQWRVQVGNWKAYRRTGNEGDRVNAGTDWFDDHVIRQLNGAADNFLAEKTIPFGHVIYPEPTTDFPGVRLRFTPSFGKVYGFEVQGDLVDEARVVYDKDRGMWHRFGSPGVSTHPSGSTSPGGIERPGFFDDTCDGIVEARLTVGTASFLAYARISSGPPDFAPDSLPVRTLFDDFEQLVEGPAVTGQPSKREVADYLRRALETIRLVHVPTLNVAGMSGHDVGFGRENAPIYDPAIWGSLDTARVRMIHTQNLLLFLNNVNRGIATRLRHYDAVGNLEDNGRQSMPAMMRGGDGRHVALTTRQVNKIAAAEQNGSRDDLNDPDEQPVSISPKNLTAQVQFRAAGNPPSSRPESSIANCFPGLEFDIRNLWRRLFADIELHEAINTVVAVSPAAPAEIQQLLNSDLIEVDGLPIEVPADRARYFVNGQHKSGMVQCLGRGCVCHCGRQVRSSLPVPRSNAGGGGIKQ